MINGTTDTRQRFPSSIRRDESQYSEEFLLNHVKNNPVGTIVKFDKVKLIEVLRPDGINRDKYDNPMGDFDFSIKDFSIIPQQTGKGLRVRFLKTEDGCKLEEAPKREAALSRMLSKRKYEHEDVIAKQNKPKIWPF